MKKFSLIALTFMGSLSATKLRWIDGNFDDDVDSVTIDKKGTIHSLM